MPIFRDYLRKLREVRNTGQAVPETSYYGTLETLLNDLGKSLKPRVRSVINLKNRGAGIPDGGLFTEEQFAASGDDPFGAGQLPSRGVLEVKPTAEAVEKTAQSAQVAKYLERYGLVLVTNYRDFLLVETGANGQATPLERYTIADEAAFWSEDIGSLVDAHSERLKDFLRRVMSYRAPLKNPKDLAWFLASYAREALSRLETSDLPSLQNVREALEDALGINFQGQKGDHFFRSTLVQTLFYGVFSAWVLWSKSNPPTSDAKFNWKEAAWTLQVPVIRALFERVATPSRLNTLHLVEVLNWTGDALNRVDRAAFFETFSQGQAVQYFYEPFLDAFDPELRRELGVWYTPPEVVRYMVERVDLALRDELGIPDGLADENVYVLDPCCGTGTYLLEVLGRIGKTLKDRGGDALLGSDLKKAALSRVVGFELLPAPFVVAHLQLGLLLQELGTSLKDDGERAAVYLTNALTGWDVSEKGEKVAAGYPELQQEHDLAENVKDETPILVVLGNPPYNAFAGTSSEAEQGLVEVYKEGLRDVWGIKKYNLDELYVRFFRMAEKRIAEKTGKGIVCYISSFSYLSDPSFVVMRQRLLNEFDSFWFDCMNGDSRETGKVTPDGQPDPSVFSTELNPAGIRVGTSIALMTRKEEREEKPTVRFRHFWGATKRADLLESLKSSNISEDYQLAKPIPETRYSFRPADIDEEYFSWSKVVDLAEIAPHNGPVERRGGSLIRHLGEEQSFEVLRSYLDETKTDEEVKTVEPRFMTSSGEFDAAKAREMLKASIKYNEELITMYPFKPFDIRLAYLTNEIQPLFSRPSPELLAATRVENNAFFVTRDTADKRSEGVPFYFSEFACDYDSLSGHARHFPLFYNFVQEEGKGQQGGLFEGEHISSVRRANLSQKSRGYLKRLRIEDPDEDAETAGLIWMHALAIGYSPSYLTENSDGVRQDWPRIPLPNAKEGLETSASLGREVAGLLETETPVAGVTSGKVREELRGIGNVSAVAGQRLDSEKDLVLTAGWGHFGARNAVMPGKGRAVTRDYTPEELAGFEAGATSLGVSVEELLDLLGTTTYDVYLNDKAYWKNIPSRVWDYTIGGYQVIKKWLSYREAGVLGRSLEVSEARHITETARRIAGLLVLEPKLNENYQAVKAEVHEWPA